MCLISFWALWNTEIAFYTQRKWPDLILKAFETQLVQSASLCMCCLKLHWIKQWSYSDFDGKNQVGSALRVSTFFWLASFSCSASNKWPLQYVLSLQFLNISGWLMKLGALLHWQLMKKLWCHTLDAPTSAPMAPPLAMNEYAPETHWKYTVSCLKQIIQPAVPSTASSPLQVKELTISVTVWHTYVSARRDGNGFS